MIFRVEKTKDYTTMSNFHLREKDMSLKAKGLLSWMLSNDDDWDYSIAGIVANCKENETAIKTALKELQDFGYLEVIKKSPDKEVSTIHYEYIVHEKPINQDIENLPLENLVLENQVQRNTNIRNTKKRSLLSKDNISGLVDTVEKKKSGKSQYVKCMELINDFTDDAILQEYLQNCYKLFNENAREAGTPFYTNTFKGKINKLKQLSDDNYEQREIVLQTLDNGWNSFYALKKDKTYGNKKVASDMGYEIKRSNKKKLMEDIANGTAEKF